MSRQPIAQPRQSGAWIWNLIGLLFVAVTIAVLALMFGWQPPQLLGTPKTTIGEPTPPAVARPAQVAPPVQQPPAPIIIQAAPDAPPPVVVAPAPQPPASEAQGVPAPKPQIIIIRQDETTGASTITGSGACAVRSGARRCAKP